MRFPFSSPRILEVWQREKPLLFAFSDVFFVLLANSQRKLANTPVLVACSRLREWTPNWRFSHGRWVKTRPRLVLSSDWGQRLLAGQHLHPCLGYLDVGLPGLPSPTTNSSHEALIGSPKIGCTPKGQSAPSPGDDLRLKLAIRLRGQTVHSDSFGELGCDFSAVTIRLRLRCILRWEIAKFASRFRLRFKKSLAIAVAMPWCTQLRGRTARQRSKKGSEKVLEIICFGGYRPYPGRANPVKTRLSPSDPFAHDPIYPVPKYWNLQCIKRVIFDTKNHHWISWISWFSWFPVWIGGQLVLQTQRSKKGSEKVLERVLGKGSQKGSEKGVCYGFHSRKGFWEGFSEGVLRRGFPEGA